MINGARAAALRTPALLGLEGFITWYATRSLALISFRTFFSDLRSLMFDSSVLLHPGRALGGELSEGLELLEWSDACC